MTDSSPHTPESVAILLRDTRFKSDIAIAKVLNVMCVTHEIEPDDSVTIDLAVAYIEIAARLLEKMVAEKYAKNWAEPCEYDCRNRKRNNGKVDR